MNIKKASSGKEAIRLCGVNTFDLILMDHMMPEMDGVEAMHAIREKYPEYVKKPIIALTANAVGDAKKALLDEGMNDFIPKPIDVKTLMAVVRKWLPAHLIMKMTDELNVVLEEITRLKKENLQKQNNIEELSLNYERQIDALLNDFISVIDAYEKVETKIKEMDLPEDDNIQRVIKRLLQPKRTALSVLSKNGISQIDIIGRPLNEDICVVVETEPDMWYKI